MEQYDCEIGNIDIEIIKKMYKTNNYKQLKHINNISLQIKRQYVKEIYCKNQLEELKNHINLFDKERIKIIYNSNNYACLKEYNECSILIKQELIKIKMDLILIEEHTEQLARCLEDYDINEEIVDHFNKKGYNIFDDNFLDNVDFALIFVESNETFVHIMDVMKNCGKNNDDINKAFRSRSDIQDMYIFKRLDKCYNKDSEKLKLNLYHLLSEDEKEMITTINYYDYQKKRINNQLLNFNKDIFGEIFKYLTKPKQISNMSLISKTHYEISKNIIIQLSRGQICKYCNVCIFRRTLLEQCSACNKEKHLKCGNIMFNTIDCVIDCIPLIIQHFKAIDFVNLGFVCKSIYEIVKTFVIKQKPIKLLCNNNKVCKNYVCVVGRSLENKILCGDCLSIKVYYNENISERNWAKCRDCNCQFFVKGHYDGRRARCSSCRQI